MNLTQGLSAASVRLGKTEALALLTRQAGLEPRQSCDSDVESLIARLPRLTNCHVELRRSSHLSNVKRTLHTPALQREIAQPHFTNSRPECFPAYMGLELSPALEVLELPQGILAQVARAPVVLTSDGQSIIQDYSSRYAGLIYGLEFDLRRLLSEVVRVSGTALVLCDDVHPLNYCHWLLDELPRIAVLGERRDVTLITSDHDSSFKRETLRLCGFSDSHVFFLRDYQSVQADRLLVTSDIADMPHPAHKAAPWAIDFLRARLGFAALAQHRIESSPAKLFVSRDDADGRRIINEQALTQLLEPVGYQRITLAGRSVVDQIALFSNATHVLGAHGAGLTNFAFAPASSQLLEIFPVTYGTPTYYIVAAGQGLAYATYVARDVVSGSRAQTDDLRLDIDDFRRSCEMVF